MLYTILLAIIALLVHQLIHRDENVLKLKAQNALLYNQLAAYKRRHKRPIIRQRDRCLWVAVKKFFPSLLDSLLFITPDTLCRWERKLVKDLWRWKSKTDKVGRPRIPIEHINWIKRISAENPGRSAVYIAGELKTKLGVSHAPSTIERYMIKARPPSDGQKWRTFLKNEGKAIWCCDFMTYYSLFFSPMTIFVIMELGSRKIVNIGITQHPTLLWIEQEIKFAIGWGESPKFLIHDNDGKFGQLGKSVPAKIRTQNGIEKSVSCRSTLDYWLATVMNIRGIPIPFMAPNANAHCERLIQTLQIQCLDHVIILHKNHLRKILDDFKNYYNHGRHHQGIDKIPDPYPELLEDKPENGKLVSIPVLGGLHHDYRLVA